MSAGMDLRGKRFFCSWSGGKDSALSLYKAVAAGGVPAALLTMMVESGERSRSHGLVLEVIQAQASALGIPLVTRSASWSTYEDVFRQAASEFVAQGISVGVFGDIDLDEHREWCVRVCREAGAEAHHPLWKMRRADVVKEFLDAGFEAYIVAMKDGLGARAEDNSDPVETSRTPSSPTGSNLLSLLGTPFSKKAVELMVEQGVDACGESGEFHTVVTGGPLFSRSLELEFGRKVLKDEYWFVDSVPRG